MSGWPESSAKPPACAWIRTGAASTSSSSSPTEKQPEDSKAEADKNAPTTFGGWSAGKKDDEGKSSNFSWGTAATTANTSSTTASSWGSGATANPVGESGDKNAAAPKSSASTSNNHWAASNVSTTNPFASQLGTANAFGSTQHAFTQSKDATPATTTTSTTNVFAYGSKITADEEAKAKNQKNIAAWGGAAAFATTTTHASDTSAQKSTAFSGTGGVGDTTKTDLAAAPPASGWGGKPSNAAASFATAPNNINVNAFAATSTTANTMPNAWSQPTTGATSEQKEPTVASSTTRPTSFGGSSTSANSWGVPSAQKIEKTEEKEKQQTPPLTNGASINALATWKSYATGNGATIAAPNATSGFGSTPKNGNSDNFAVPLPPTSAPSASNWNATAATTNAAPPGFADNTNFNNNNAPVAPSTSANDWGRPANAAVNVNNQTNMMHGAARSFQSSSSAFVQLQQELEKEKQRANMLETQLQSEKQASAMKDQQLQQKDHQLVKEKQNSLAKDAEIERLRQLLNPSPFVKDKLYQIDFAVNGIIPPADPNSFGTLLKLPSAASSPLLNEVRSLFRTAGSWAHGTAQPVAGFELKEIEVINAEVTSLETRMRRLQQLRAKDVGTFFNPSSSSFNVDQLQTLISLRDQFLPRPSNATDKTPNLINVFHGTKVAKLDSVVHGLVAVRSTDAGFFGLGVYTTTSIEYAAKYARGDFDDKDGPYPPRASDGCVPVIWCVAAVGVCYPVTPQEDYKKRKDGNSDFFGAGLNPGYDCHCVGVSQSNGFQSVPRKDTQYMEIVFDQEAQVLPIAVLWVKPT